MRCRSKTWRVRRLRELPPDDGLVPAMLDGRQVFVDPEMLRPAFEAKMAMHDGAHPMERWGHNQWGAGWLQSPMVVRGQFEWQAPRLKSDLSQMEYLERVRQYQREEQAMAISMAKREKLPSKDFALPGKGSGKGGKGPGSYPIPDASHARNALARASQSGSPKVKAEVKKAVKRKFPGIEQSKGKGARPTRGK